MEYVVKPLLNYVTNSKGQTLISNSTLTTEDQGHCFSQTKKWNWSKCTQEKKERKKKNLKWLLYKGYHRNSGEVIEPSWLHWFLAGWYQVVKGFYPARLCLPEKGEWVNRSIPLPVCHPYSLVSHGTGLAPRPGCCRFHHQQDQSRRQHRCGPTLSPVSHCRVTATTKHKGSLKTWTSFYR